jgi:hypothetical protein
MGKMTCTPQTTALPHPISTISQTTKSINTILPDFLVGPFNITMSTAGVISNVT